MNGCNKVKQIAWTRHQGALYGVAHDSKGDPLGNVRVERADGRYYMVAYELGRNWDVGYLPLVTGDKKLKERASSKLLSLLEAA